MYFQNFNLFDIVILLGGTEKILTQLRKHSLPNSDVWSDFGVWIRSRPFQYPFV